MDDFLIWACSVAAGKSTSRVYYRLQFKGRILVVSWANIRLDILSVHFWLQLFKICE